MFINPLFYWVLGVLVEKIEILMFRILSVFGTGGTTEKPE